MTDIDEKYIDTLNKLTASLDRVAVALETHLPPIAAGANQDNQNKPAAAAETTGQVI